MMGGDVTDERTGQGLVVHGAPTGRRDALAKATDGKNGKAQNEQRAR
jgi:hypothetical protein